MYSELVSVTIIYVDVNDLHTCQDIYNQPFTKHTLT